jgi:hypothetical protein
MKSMAALSYVIALTLFGLAGSARAADLAECTPKQLLGPVPAQSEQEAHRQFPVPTLTYAPGQGLDENDPWGLMLQVRVDASGRVACYRLKDQFDREVESNEQRRRLLAGLRQWRYQPFVRNGTAVDVVVREEIREEQAPPAHRPLPEVPIEQVQLGLRRTGCLGPCPSYNVEVHGDGRVVYTGEEYVDVTGEHTYRIAPERVAKLVESLRSKDIWSLREEYYARITDSPTYVLTLRFGEEVHQLVDYVGTSVGMPKSVSDFEDEIDAVSEAKGFIHLSRAAVERLKAEGFEFRSQAGADLLARVVSSEESHDNAAMLRLIELGAPVVGAKQPDRSLVERYGSLLEQALIGRRAELIDPLIQRGLLETNGAPDQSKIDRAFQAAVMGGRLASIEKIWAIAGTTAHPSLTFEDVTDDEQRVRKTAPVAVLLRRAARDPEAWEGLAVTRWLAARGCDIKGAAADGETLLHIAASAGDVELVRYLLNQGFDASTPGRYGGLALGSTYNEDVALLLLEAGTDLSKVNDSGYSFRAFAEYGHWARVVAWLDAH